MIRFFSKVLGVTVLALGLIWSASPGDAVQTSGDVTTILWADTAAVQLAGDTVHINVDQQSASEVPPRRGADTFMSHVRNLTQTAFHIRNHYMEDVDIEEIIKAGVDGMLSDLDRFSVLMEQQSYENLMESTHGRYQGLGLQIDSRDDYITIIAPIEGTPAYRKRLRAGDIIWEIDGQSSYRMSSSDAAKLMRGDAGTSITLTIKRQGIPELLEFEIERAVIQLKSVNYYGVIRGTDIGYVRLSRFAEETSHELREALATLNEQNISALIFDLRSNGGGLLDQAKETAELFLEEGSEIVYTKGRYEDSERHFVSERPPVFEPGKPLVILVDQGTASASEIVAGAVQDWDRGLIIGSATYGKGLVQQLFPVANDRSLMLKLTTAKYYVPSGRCIQKPERQEKETSPTRAESTEGDEADTLAIAEREVFYTNGGRVVYGGGGIVPDIDVEREIWQPIEINLERKSMFFDFAIQYVAAHPDVTVDFEVTDAVMEEFRNYLEEKEFDYKTALEITLEEFRETVTEKDREATFNALLDSLQVAIELVKKQDFEESREYISRAIKREVVQSIAGERGFYEQLVLKGDKTVLKAVEVLQAPNEYARLITEGQRQSGL
jgi:carboxyl-terminal processing protease